MRRTGLVLLALALALTGCETTAEKSAKLEAAAKRQEQAATSTARAPRAPSITRTSTVVKVLAGSVLRSSAAAAAVVTVRNLSGAALRDVPIEITVRSASGSSLYTNDMPGLADGLADIPLLAAHGELTWVDDQVPANGAPSSVSAKIGEGERVTAPSPPLSVSATTLSDGSASEPSAEGSVVNHSALAQSEVVVYALARRAGRIVAAGRALLAQAAAASATRFQLYFVGDPRGAQLQFSAVAGAA